MEYFGRFLLFLVETKHFYIAHSRTYRYALCKLILMSAIETVVGIIINAIVPWYGGYYYYIASFSRIRTWIVRTVCRNKQD